MVHEKPGAVLTHHIIIKYGHFMTFWLIIKCPKNVSSGTPCSNTPPTGELMLMDKLHNEIIMYYILYIIYNIKYYIIYIHICNTQKLIKAMGYRKNNCRWTDQPEIRWAIKWDAVVTPKCQ